MKRDTEKYLSNLSKKHSKYVKYDMLRAITDTLLLISLINVIIAFINIWLSSSTIRGIVYWINIVIIAVIICNYVVYKHNLNVRYKELEDKSERLGYRKGFNFRNRWQLKSEVKYKGKKYLVSTVDLGINHNFGAGEPLYYETMIFDSNRNEEYMERYSTLEEAMARHKEILKKFKNGDVEDLIND